jgi:hypothetical protein
MYTRGLPLTAPTVAQRLGDILRSPRSAAAIDIALVMLATATIASLMRAGWSRFAFWGDNAESFLPFWHYLGGELRNGRMPLFEPERWASGNHIAEAAYGIFNPVTLMNAIAVSFSSDIAAAAAALSIQFLAILSAGVYLLARTYGARRRASVIAALIVPLAGFTLFYGASNWLSGLMSITWVVHFWWTARRYTLRRTGPAAPLLVGALAVTVGNPYSVLGGLSCCSLWRSSYSSLATVVGWAVSSRQGPPSAPSYSSSTCRCSVSFSRSPAPRGRRSSTRTT